MSKVKYMLTSFFIITFFLSCKQSKPFNEQGWATKDDIGGYPEREAMVDDLVSNHLKGAHCNKVIAMLGRPDELQGAVLCYNIITDYGTDIDPVYTRNLEVYFKDSIVNAIHIVEKP